MGKNISRKHFISASLGAAACLPLTGANIFGAGFNNKESKINSTERRTPPGSLKICIFSKHLQWLNYREMASLAAEMGFDGIDLTVRPNGHVLPERVAEDLPKAVEATEKAGLQIYTITTNIKGADERYTESILRTASGLGIQHYRTGWFTYDDTLDIPGNIRLVKNK